MKRCIMKRKRWLGMLLAAVMVLTMVPGAVFAAEEGYVEVQVTYADGYEAAEQGDDTGRARIDEAERVLDNEFSSLEEAADAFLSLYSKEGDYNYDYANVTGGTAGLS